MMDQFKFIAIIIVCVVVKMILVENLVDLSFAKLFVNQCGCLISNGGDGP